MKWREPGYRKQRVRATLRLAALAIPVVLALVLALPMLEAAKASSPRPAGGAIGPTLLEIGQTQDGLVTTIAHGYAPASATISSLAGEASGDFSFRVGGYCLASAEVSLVPTGVSGNTTVWSYQLSGVTVALVEDAPSGSCKYTARVTYALSVTGAVTINQMEYTVYFRGRVAPGGAGRGLTLIP